MRLWHLQPLTGLNEYHRFAINREDVSHLVVLSITKASEGFVHVDKSLARELNVSLFVTVPEFFLHDLVTKGGTAIDLCTFLWNWRDAGVVSELHAREVLREYRNACHVYAINLLTGATGEDIDAVSKAIVGPLGICAVALSHLTRGMMETTEKNLEQPATTLARSFGMLGDICMEDTETICVALALGTMRLMEEKTPHHVWFPLINYSGGACFLNGRKDKAYGDNVWLEAIERYNTGIHGPGLFFVYTGGLISVNCIMRQEESVLESLLNRIVEESQKSA